MNENEFSNPVSIEGETPIPQEKKIGKKRGPYKKREKPAEKTGETTSTSTSEPAPSNDPENLNLKDETNKLRAGYAQIKIDPKTPPEVKEEFNELISGSMLLVVCDFIFPNIIVFLFRKRKPGLTVQKLKLTKDEREELEPVADAAAKYLLKGMNPVQLFFLCMGATYIGKMQDIN